MEKRTSKDNETLRKLRSIPGMSSMVELREDGTIIAKRGAPNEDLVAATPDFLRIGKMLGQSLGLNELINVRTIQGDEAITFVDCGVSRAGVIHRDATGQLLDTKHGT